MKSEEPPFKSPVPPHLKPFVVDQHYDAYTPVDHAVWRFVCRQNCQSLEGRAYDSYLRYFTDVGMSLEAIPNITEMDQRLQEYGWGTVTVDGFIPPGAFMDFQAHGLLPIAQDIRTLAHINYTPAPDIIHEAAGHAPYIIHPVYGRYVRRIGELGAKAISNWEEYEVFEAIRLLSLVKEDPGATLEQVHAAEHQLETAIAQVTDISEATLISRLHWWTVEYGLIGDAQHALIYGAGLLSSMSEGLDCLTDDVERIPFSLESIQYSFDITRPQPQLFVIERFEQLFETLERFADSMAFRVGGTQSLQKALRSRRVCTAEYSSGLQVSGTLTTLELDPAGEAVYFRTTGSTALAIGDVELEGHGIDAYPDGMLLPVGPARGWESGMEGATDAQLEWAGLAVGAEVRLEYLSGLCVEGRLARTVRANGAVVMLELRDARVTLGTEVLLQASTYPLPVGHRISSVFAGSADKTRFVVERQKSRFANVRQATSPLEQELHALYQRVRTAREQRLEGPALEAELLSVLEDLEARHPADWLLRLELVELMGWNEVLPSARDRILAQLDGLKSHNNEYRDLITRGLQLLDSKLRQAAA